MTAGNHAISGKTGVFRTFWEFLESLKLTVTVLLLLAGVSVIGTLVPQNQAPEDYVRAFGEFFFTLFGVLDIFDMYHAWWFRLLLILLTANIVACSVKRFPATWRFVFSGKTGGDAGKHAVSREFSDPRSFRELEPLYDALLSKRFSSRRTVSQDRGFRMIAEKGRWTKLGVYIVHLSIVLMLVGALMGSWFGFDGYVNIAEGESADRIFLRNGEEPLPLGFEIRCDAFNVEFYETGEPKEYRSALAIVENGKTVVERDILVNHPLSHRGINLFQSSYGPLAPKSATLAVANAGGEPHEVVAEMGRPASLPGDAGKITLLSFHPSYGFQGNNLGETFVARIEPAGEKPREIALPVKYPSFDKMRGGRWVVSVSAHEDRYYTGLQVTRDPGVPVVYAGFLAIIIGCVVTFFIRRVKIVAEVKETENGSVVTVTGGSGKGAPPDLKRLVENLTKAMSKS